MMEYIYDAIKKYKEDYSDNKVWITQLPVTTDENIGARMHPGVLSHKVASKNLISVIKNIYKI